MSTRACPLCGYQLIQHLVQPTMAVLVCPSEQCVYPFNLSVDELHQQKLIVSGIDDEQIVAGMKTKMVEVGVDDRIANFIAKQDRDIGLGQ
ncbi:hypothetical protein DICA4_F06612 [Diutina catenulata]